MPFVKLPAAYPMATPLPGWPVAWLSTTTWVAVGTLPKELQTAAKTVLDQTIKEARSAHPIEIRMFGRTVKEARISWLFSKIAGLTYRYSGNTRTATTPTPEITAIAEWAAASIHPKYERTLVNCYRDKNDYIGAHADSEAGLAKNQPITTVSLGGSRRFRLISTTKAHTGYEITLHHGDVLIMGGACQRQYKHTVLKGKKGEDQPRVSLTFRVHE